MFIATLIADGLSSGDIADAQARLAAAGCAPGEAVWLDADTACDVLFASSPEDARAVLEGAIAGVDVIVQPLEGREKQLLISDMDSTMITVECIDELAGYAGLRAEISGVTERAMRGELDFEAALDGRVALLKGLDVRTLETCLNERVTLMPGAKTLVRTMKARGAYTLLVSGGFTHFADPVAGEIGFDDALSNILEIDGAALAGTVRRPIVGAEAKREALEKALNVRGQTADRALAVGDGANDIPMLQAAGLGIAYHAKEKAAAAADARIVHGDLTTLLYAQGIARKHWVTG
ncbi:phosphoserine phosphatase SerB [Sphingobium boeckii]|uniref:Phosphoserine phosphatase n=1 Tax=Sphingobium boeckii TaxID=1082345 RepID=A0A7W9EFT9_9SPHN|nr:phosphoserine phosphatase SerB [Sphingobium boeckii]MBB5687469.1 phosphoserine phosphatase [Sphingobium boeckii]